jgi:hypothetical protein
MTRRSWLAAGAALSVVVLGVGAYDALTVSDEERLEQLVVDSTGRIDVPRMQAGRRRWVDLERQPLEISALGEVLYYGPGEDEALDERARQAVGALQGVELRALSSQIEVDGGRARVSIRTLGRGLGSLEWSLRKHGEDWLVERLAVRR